MTVSQGSYVELYMVLFVSLGPKSIRFDLASHKNAIDIMVLWNWKFINLLAFLATNKQTEFWYPKIGL